LSKEELEQRNAKRRERAKLRKQNAKGRQQQQQQQPQEMMPLMEPMQEAVPSLPEPDHDHFHEALDSHLVDSVRRAGAGAEQAMGGADYNHDAVEEISHV
jgi:FKBP-type peptidyl-prolyl cis-trans isomerase